jgi:hypothetical protein
LSNNVVKRKNRSEKSFCFGFSLTKKRMPSE